MVHDDKRMFAARRIITVENGLRILDVAIAVLVPDEFVDCVGVVVEAEPLKVSVADLYGLVEIVQDVLIVGAECCFSERRCFDVGREALRMHLHVARGIPQLGPEIATDLKFVVREIHILSSGGDHYEAEPQCIGAVFIDDRHRIDGIAKALAHLATLVIPHRPVDVDTAERDVVHELQARHYHARHPEEDDFRSSHEVVSRVIVV